MVLRSLYRRCITRFTAKKNINPYMKEFIKYHRWTDEVEVKHDENTFIPYVMHEGKKLYFPKGRSEDKIRNAYVALLKEQDLYSPHRYLSTQDMEDIKRYKNSGGVIIYSSVKRNGLKLIKGIFVFM